MSPRRQVKASINLQREGASSRRKATENIANLPRTRSGHLVGRSLSISPSKSAPSSGKKYQASSSSSPRKELLKLTTQSSPSSPRKALSNSTTQSSPSSPRKVLLKSISQSSPSSPRKASLKSTTQSSPSSPRKASLKSTTQSSPSSPRKALLKSTTQSSPSSPKKALLKSTTQSSSSSPRKALLKSTIQSSPLSSRKALSKPTTLSSPSSPKKASLKLTAQSSPSTSTKSTFQKTSPTKTSPRSTKKSTVGVKVNSTGAALKVTPTRATKNISLLDPAVKRKLENAGQSFKSSEENLKNLKTTPKKSAQTPSHIATRSPARHIITRSSPQSRTPSRASPVKGVVNSPSKTPSKSIKSPMKESSAISQKSPGSLSRKRLLSSPSKSPQTAKRSLRGNVLIPLQLKNEADSDDDIVVLDKVSMEVRGPDRSMGHIESGGLSIIPKQKENPHLKKAGTALPSDPELSGRFLRRKWFSLKTRGGFTCLRSAILSPEEIAKEVIQHTMVEPPKDHDANFFTTKLMVRLSSRLPPSRARPSCEELVDLFHSKQMKNNSDEQKEPKKEGTAIRVKVEKRSFNDTISHVTNNPSKSVDEPPTSNGSPSKIRGVFPQNHGNLTKKEEREIALQQLKNLRFW